MIKKTSLPLMFSAPGASYDGEPALPEALANNQFGRSRIKFFDVPREMIVCKSGIYNPIQGRYWEVDLYCYLGMYLSEEELRKRPMFDGNLYLCKQACLIERWYNHGDDGHTDYWLVGYALVPSIDEAERYHRFQVEDGAPRDSSYEDETYTIRSTGAESEPY